MTLRQVLVQAGLAASALVLAYLVWQRGPELAAGEALVADLAKHDLATVRFEDPEKSSWVELGHATDEHGSYVTVRLSPQDRPASAKAPDQAATKTPARLVRGSEAAEKLLASFTPLRASRSLGVLGQAKLKELGLDTTKKRITLTLRNGKRSFAIAPAPTGGTLPYLLDEADRRVYVVARSFLSDFQTAASLLVERRLHACRLEEADRVQVTMGKVQRELVVTRSDGQVRLALASSPAQPDAGLKTWHDRIFSLWPVDVLGKDEIPAEGNPQNALRLDYAAGGRPLGFLEIAKVAALTSSGEDAKAKQDALFARSERTLGWVKLGTDAQNLLADTPAALR
jgi:hypothetical protein